MSRIRSLLSFLSLCAVAVGVSLARFFDAVFRPSPFVLDVATPGGLSLRTDAGTVAPSLFQVNRHEAGVSRRSAARNV